MVVLTKTAIMLLLLTPMLPLLQAHNVRPWPRVGVDLPALLSSSSLGSGEKNGVAVSADLASDSAAVLPATVCRHRYVLARCTQWGSNELPLPTNR